MSVAADPRPELVDLPAPRLRQMLAQNGPLLAGLLCLVVPTLISLVSTLWHSEDQAQGPLVLCVVLWAMWRRRRQFYALPAKTHWLGWPLLLLGLLAYVVGKSQAIYLLNVGAFIPVVAGVLLLKKGWPGLRLMAFPVGFMVFLVPLPGFIVDSITASLKQSVSTVAEALLYAAGLPVARSGVTLTVGRYELLVADACSGMNSMFSLFALGLVYLYLQNYLSKLRNVLLLGVIAPVAFFSNIVRVVVLALVTYGFGDAAGQGFIHEFAGLVLFAVALGVIFLIDKCIPESLLTRKAGGLR